MQIFHKVVPRSKTLQRYVLGPYNIRVPEEQSVWGSFEMSVARHTGRSSNSSVSSTGDSVSSDGGSRTLHNKGRSRSKGANSSTVRRRSRRVAVGRSKRSNTTRKVLASLGGGNVVI